MKIHITTARPRILTLVSSLFLGLLVACSHTQTAPTAPQPTVTSEAPAKSVKPFSSDTLYSLLTAEFAGNRKNYEVALNNYAQQARQTHDPQIAERATLLARYLGDTDTAQETAQIWLDSSPNNRDALSNSASAALDAGDLFGAFKHSKQLLGQGADPLFQIIAARAGKLSANDHQALLKNFQDLLSKHPKNEQLLVGTGLLLEQDGQVDAAMMNARAALNLNADSIPAAILEASLLHQLTRDQEAADKMAKLVANHPNNVYLRQQYARILIHTDLAQAQQEFAKLSEQQPNNGDIWLSLGIVALQREDLNSARSAFEALLDTNQHLATAHYYLGHIAENENKLPEAVLHYLQVDQGNDFYSANLSLLDIFVRLGDYESARQQVNRLALRHPEQAENFFLLYGEVLRKHQEFQQAEDNYSDGLKIVPNNFRLLLARALLNEKRERLEAAEADLRIMLALKPDNADTLNALGYFLADHNYKLNEAHLLISQALQLDPNNPAILDSMGWVEYRAARLTNALHYLAQAYELSKDAEIGAHYGEVLWRSNNQTAAKKIWAECLKASPNNAPLRATMTRFEQALD